MRTPTRARGGEGRNFTPSTVVECPNDRIPNLFLLTFEHFIVVVARTRREVEETLSVPGTPGARRALAKRSKNHKFLVQR